MTTPQQDQQARAQAQKEAQDDSKALQDAKINKEISERQFYGNRESAIDDAISSGRAKSREDAENRSTWSQEYKDKVGDASIAYAKANSEESDARTKIAEKTDSGYDGNLDPEVYKNTLLAKGTGVNEINKSLYLSEDTNQRQTAINNVASEMQKNNDAQIEKNKKQIALNDTINVERAKKSDENILIIANPASTPEAVAAATAANKSLATDIKTAEADTKKLGDTNSAIAANNTPTQRAAAAKAQLDKDPAGPKNVSGTIKRDASGKEIGTTTKLSNTGFEGINNYAPFYMQFPTLKAITDFHLRNGFSPYGDRGSNEIARDAVNFRIFETLPGTSSAEHVPGPGNLVRNVIDSVGVQSVGSFTIYPSETDWISQTHQHTYTRGSEDLVVTALNTIGGGLENLDSLLKVGTAIGKAINEGTTTGLGSLNQVYQRKASTINKYESTEPQTLSIKFNLFTKDDFLADVFRPIMFLTALGYPKRATSGNTGKQATDAGKEIGSLIDGGINKLTDDNPIKKWLTAAKEKVGGVLQLTADEIQELENKLGSIGGIGPYRYYISKRPEYLSVRHVSGLFNFPLANITSFSYVYKGPWYNSSGDPLPYTSDLDVLIKTPVINDTSRVIDQDLTFSERLAKFGHDVSEVFSPTPPKSEPDIAPSPTSRRANGTPGGLLYRSSVLAGTKRHGLDYAYPSIAECTLTVVSSVPFYRDDYMDLYYNSKSGADLVKVTQQNTGDTTFSGPSSVKDALANTERYGKTN